MRIVPIVAFVFLALGAPHVQAQSPDRNSTKIGDIRFTIPAGLELRQVAGEGLIKWPIVVDFDTAGNLLVVESGGVAKPIEEHNKLGLHRIVRLIDQDGDGDFDQRVVVADQLPFTEGVLAIGNDILACAPPNIYRLVDADGDGICERRDVWFDGQTITGCANDLHGPYMGRDGWVYWCKGAFAEQNHTLISGLKLKSTAAHIFRRRLEGGPIEPVMSGGMDNPVEVAITPEGERFFTSTFLQHPGNGLRDGIAHAIYGGLYGKPHKVLDGHIRTGPLMPIMTQLGPAAPSGLICLSSHQLVGSSPGVRTLVAAEFNLQKVSAHELIPQGASFTTRDFDLMVADRVDFHPTDILEDTDGNLLVVDTGGWYDLCCPTSRIDQKTAAGAIYRLSRPGTAKPARRAASTASVSNADVLQRLHDSRPWVARLQLLQLRQLAAPQQQSLVKSLAREVHDPQLPLDVRLQSLWGLCNLEIPDSESALLEALKLRESALLQTACHAVSVRRCKAAATPLAALMTSDSLAVRRAAAEALGRIGNLDSVPALMMGCIVNQTDRALEHSIAYALIELQAGQVVAKFAALQSSPRQQQVAMTVLDQLGMADQLAVDFMLAAVSSADPVVSNTASEILGKYPQWSNKYAEALRQRLVGSRGQGELPSVLLTIASGWKSTDAVKQLVTEWLSEAATADSAQQAKALQLLEIYAGAELDAAWSQPLANWLASAAPDLRSRLVSCLAQVDLSAATQVKQRLLDLAKAATSPGERLALLAALPAGTESGDSELESAVLASLQAEDDPNAYQSGLQALKRIKLSKTSGSQLLSHLKTQPPRGLAVSVEAINRLRDDQLDQAMLSAIAELPAARTLSSDQLRNLYRNRNKELQGLADRTAQSLARAPEDVEAKVEATLAKLGPGDPIKGLTLFRGQKTACSGCHRIGYVGGEIGPELTRIGASRTRRALLEAIMFPSARLEQSYQPTKVLTHDGQVYNGLVKKQSTNKQLELQLTVDKSIGIKMEEIAQQEPSQVSIMPAGVVELLTTDELSDLLALLESAK